MKEVEVEYSFDLEKVIKNSNKKINSDKKIEANYILEKFSNNVSLDIETLKNAKIKTKTVIIDRIKKNKRKKVVKDFIMTEKNRLKIIRQTILFSKVNKVKEISSSIELFDNEDIINEGYLKLAGELTNEIPLAKKLINKPEK